MFYPLNHDNVQRSPPSGVAAPGVGPTGPGLGRPFAPTDGLGGPVRALRASAGRSRGRHTIGRNQPLSRRTNSRLTLTPRMDPAARPGFSSSPRFRALAVHQAHGGDMRRPDPCGPGAKAAGTIGSSPRMPGRASLRATPMAISRYVKPLVPSPPPITTISGSSVRMRVARYAPRCQPACEMMSTARYSPASAWAMTSARLAPRDPHTHLPWRGPSRSAPRTAPCRTAGAPRRRGLPTAGGAMCAGERQAALDHAMRDACTYSYVESVTPSLTGAVLHLCHRTAFDISRHGHFGSVLAELTGQIHSQPPEDTSRITKCPSGVKERAN